MCFCVQVVPTWFDVRHLIGNHPRVINCLCWLRQATRRKMTTMGMIGRIRRAPFRAATVDPSDALFQASGLLAFDWTPGKAERLAICIDLA
jgi:hypothetical protein